MLHLDAAWAEHFADVQEIFAQIDCGLCTQGEKSAVRYLFRKGLEVNSRSRYVHLSWGTFERDNGQVDNARELFRRGHLLNPQDAPILQVGHAS